MKNNWKRWLIFPALLPFFSWMEAKTLEENQIQQSLDTIEYRVFVAVDKAGVEHWGGNELEGNRAGFLESSLHSRAQIILDPAQAVNNLRGVSAKAHDLADSFVKCAVGVIAEGLITNHPQWHGAGNHTGHGANTVHAVVGDKMNLTGSGHFCRLLQGGSHPFIYRGPHNSTLHRAAHLFPGDRRARMADGMVI